jgi:hypothetical protein
MWYKVGRNVASGAPQIAANRRRPLQHRVKAILAKGVNNGAASGLQGLVHLFVGSLHETHLGGVVVGSLLLHHFWNEAAQVVLEIVDAPGCVELGVLLLVAQRALVASASLGPRRGIDADLQPLGMHVIG